MKNFKKCKVENCENTKIKARGFCIKHLSQYYRHGDITKYEKEKKEKLNKKCKVENCENTKIKAKGLCGKHYAQILIYNKIMDEQHREKREDRINKKCKVENCNRSAFYKNKGKGEFCNRHYLQIKRNGKILERTIFDKNEIIDCGDYYEICLYNVKHEEVGRTLIDKEDLRKVKNYKWYLNNKGYAVNKTGKNNLSLHHLIFGYPPIGYEVDHQDTDPLNNRKYNLRFVTHQQNLQNRKSKGYSWVKSRNKWETYIQINNKKINLGHFTDEQTAAKVAREARQKYFGEFAYKRTNQ